MCRPILCGDFPLSDYNPGRCRNHQRLEGDEFSSALPRAGQAQTGIRRCCNRKLVKSGERQQTRKVNLPADLAHRHAAIRQAITPLPGSRPQDHFKPINIPGACDGWTLLAALQHMVWNVSAADWRAEFDRGRIVTRQQQPVALQVGGLAFEKRRVR